MKTLCYYIERNSEYNKFLATLDFVATSIPCFVSLTDVEMGYVELTVLCREADALFFQTSLSPFV